MAASVGFPFTNAQLKELERQAMIYKYMMASVPVPLDLLLPFTRNLSASALSHSPCNFPVHSLRQSFQVISVDVGFSGFYLLMFVILLTCQNLSFEGANMPSSP